MEFSLVKLMELLTLVFGVCCIGISIFLYIRFKKVKSHLARALALQLLAEAIVGLVTVIFALTSWFNLYDQLTPYVLAFLRITIFFVATLSSINLYIRVREIERG